MSKSASIRDFLIIEQKDVYWDIESSVFIDMFKNINSFIGLIHRDNLLICKFRNSKFDLKDKFANN